MRQLTGMNAAEMLSKELVPFYTALAWIVFWTGLLVFARKHLSAVFEALALRVSAGSSLTVGPFTIGEPPKDLKAPAPEPQQLLTLPIPMRFPRN
jgi:hypothetical protein